MVKFKIEAVDLKGNTTQHELYASSEEEARSMFLCGQRSRFPDNKFTIIEITTSDIRRRLKSNG